MRSGTKQRSRMGERGRERERERERERGRERERIHLSPVRKPPQSFEEIYKSHCLPF